MPQAIIDPERVRHFVATLQIEASKVNNAKRNVEHSFRDLKESWNDEKYRKFEQLLTQTMVRLERYFNRTEVYANYLLTKARKAEQYLENRY